MLAQVLKQNGLLGNVHGLVPHAFQITHHAHGAHHKAQVASHGLNPGQHAQGLFVNLVFQLINGRIPVNDRCRTGRRGFVKGAKALVKGNAHRGKHDQQAGTQPCNGLTGKLFFLFHGNIPSAAGYAT